MILEMKVPSPGESIKEVEIATWLVKDGDYVEKDQAIAEVDSEKATLELSAETSGIITLKAEEGDTVAVGSVVCLIDTDIAKPSGSARATTNFEVPVSKVNLEIKLPDSTAISFEDQSIGVNSDIKLIEQVFLKLLALKRDNSKRIVDLESNFDKDRKKLEAKRLNLIREKENMLKKEDFVIEAVNSAKSEYNKVSIYLWSTFTVGTILVILNFYNNGFNFSHYVKFLLTTILITYIFAKNIGEHIEFISRIYQFSKCHVKPPFFYMWFQKPTLEEIASNFSTKYLSDTRSKYDKLIYDAETELNLTVQHLKATKNKQLDTMNREMNEIVNAFVIQLNLAQDRLEKVAQTSSRLSNIIENNSDIKINQKIYTQQFNFSHFENIQIDNTNHVFPTYFQFGNTMNIHIEKNGNDIKKIKDIVRDIIFRNLIGLKFSKLKLTMYDPIELGAFFSDFHNLNKEITDGIVYHTIDELNDILDSSLRHISMVVQKILTNKYHTLDDFNEQNTDLAEPYKFLIINDFPKSFDDYQIEKTKQIISSGPKCGVFTILIGNITNFGLNPINSINVSKINPVFSGINVDSIVNTINIGTIAAGTILVDLNTILLDENSWWTNDSSSFIELPLGKRGKEIQSLKFDNKDDNQALMIGKPGSGKSNLLHVIILSAITKYGPSDLEIYLIDFKGGVEFMSYAEYNIPQLRTVALESDREFGLSVIDGVDKELLRRETLFRNSGVQNIEQYNQKNPEQKIPRILFIVDEFQEFFKIEDDLKDQVSLRYDNIIRKGRAFGINSLFSSQTLDGHSIPRSTKELIDIRIALMCGDNDVREIMDDKNLSAKDLSRPGEAIYNPENGKSNGNHRFQAVFVERNEINEIIKKVSNKSTNGYLEKNRFIFRGDILAKIHKDNHAINNPENLKFRALRLWIGEPVSMDPDYFIDIKQVAAQNLIVIGNNHDSAGAYSSIIYSLKRQKHKIEKMFVINPLTDVDEGFESFNDAYGNYDNMNFYKLSQLDDFFDELTEIIEQRKNTNQTNTNVICIFNSINKISKFREDNLEGVGNRLFALLNEGAEYGVHLFIHCDSLISLKRTTLYSCISLFNHRIVFGMSQDGYYEIIGSNQIKNLKPNRLVYYSDELGKYQIIKPYELINNF